jgi:glycolate oxidase iron-sulfur subunit
MRKMLMLSGCVQPAMMPNINSATARVGRCRHPDRRGVRPAAAAPVKFPDDKDGGRPKYTATLTPGGRMSSGIEALVMNAGAASRSGTAYPEGTIRRMQSHASAG